MHSEIATNKKLKVRGFSVERLLGSGAFANVYSCRKYSTRKKYAAKVVDCVNNNSLKWGTENEIEILRTLNHHRNIVRLYGVTRDPECIIIILEYIPGKDFLEGIMNWPRFNEQDAKTVTKQLLTALKYCHSKRIVHRDVCPENIVWCDVPTSRKTNTTPLLKLIDFNLARKIPEYVTFLHADPLGNPSYMAPECLGEKPLVKFETDVWSVGVICFTLLGGYPPFFNRNYNHLLNNIIEANYVLPESLWNHVSSNGKDFVRNILLQDCNERHSAEYLLTQRWFQDIENNNLDAWPAQTRLDAFLTNLNEKKKCRNHRKYTLTIEERKPFIPDVEMITFPILDSNENTVAINSTKVDDNITKTKFHW